MYNSVTGEITFKGEDRLCVQIGGVEWELMVSRKAIDRLPAVIDYLIKNYDCKDHLGG